MAFGRISTGIPGLDEIIDGGIPKYQSYLLLGSAGTGEILAALQWLLHGQEHGDRCLFVALAEPFENMQRNVDSFGWDLSDLAATEPGVSNVADTLLLLRYAEYVGQVIPVIACLKKRHSEMKSDLRRFDISSDGLLVGKEMTGLSGILSGAPRTVDSNSLPRPGAGLST